MRIKTVLTYSLIAVVCGVFIAMGISGIVSFSSGGFYQKVRDYESLRMAVDFSKVGTYSGTLRREYPAEHGQQLRFYRSSPFASEQEAQTALKGLQVQLTITEAGGQVTLDQQVTSEDLLVANANNSEESCTGCAPMPTYTPYLRIPRIVEDSIVTLQITAPAPSLRDEGVQVVGKNVYCPSASLQIIIAEWISLVVCCLLLLFGLAGFGQMFVFWRKERKAQIKSLAHAPLHKT